MDIEMLIFRSAVIDAIRSFLKKEDFLEVETPSLSTCLIPESSIEVFKTEYIKPYTKNSESIPLFLLPSPELYIKKLIAQHKRSFFEISKCYRNCESIGRQHNIEFTMLEYYFANKNYIDSISITKSMLLYIVRHLNDSPLLSMDSVEIINKRFNIHTVDELFMKYAGFSITKEHSKTQLVKYAKELQPSLDVNLENMRQAELYDMIFVHAIERNLPKDELTIVINYPHFSSCLAKESTVVYDEISAETWQMKERWEMYGRDLEICNCYTEERDKAKIDEYLKKEQALKENAIIRHPIPKDFSEYCQKMPECSGVAMGLERLLMFLTNRSDISSVMPFPTPL